MTGTVTVHRAGTYSLSVLVNGVDVVDSPFYFLEV